MPTTPTMNTTTCMYQGTKATRNEFHYAEQWRPEHEADKAINFFSNKGNVWDTKTPFALAVSVNPPHSPSLALAGLKKDIPASVDGVSYAPSLLERAGKLPQEQYIMGNIYSNNVRINSGFGASGLILTTWRANGGQDVYRGPVRFKSRPVRDE